MKRRKTERVRDGTEESKESEGTEGGKQNE